MGDLEGEPEMRLVERYRHELKADVLVAGHHGSSNASSIALLKHVRPDYLVASSGYLNRFGHPHDSVVERSELMGAKVISTASTGAQRFVINDGGLALEFAREERSDFWSMEEGVRESL
jgi:competence protein ComEC